MDEQILIEIIDELIDQIQFIESLALKNEFVKIKNHRMIYDDEEYLETQTIVKIPEEPRKRPLENSLEDPNINNHRHLRLGLSKKRISTESAKWRRSIIKDEDF